MGLGMALAVLLATLLAAAGMAGLGKLALRGRGERWADLGVGWGVLGLGLLVTSAVGLPVGPVLVPLLLAGLVAFGWRFRPGRQAWLLALLVAPLLGLAAAMPITAWDDYAHWLANARFLLEQDSFPRLGLPQPASWHAGYPYGVALVTDAASLPLRWLGLAPMAETAASCFALLLFATLAAGVVAQAGRRGSGWAMALAVLLVFWLNPGFVPRIVFTNYGEAPTAALLGLAALLLLRADAASRWQAAWVLAAVVNVKQTGLVLALLLLGGAVLLAAVERWRGQGDGAGRGAGERAGRGAEERAGRDAGERGARPAGAVALWRGAMRLAVLALPMLLTWALWQPHAAAAGGVFGFKPFGQWAWGMAGQTLASIGTVMLRKVFFSALLLAMLGLAGLELAGLGLAGLGLAGLAPWRGRGTPAARLALLAAPLLAGWPCFLFVTYMGGSFAPDEVARAASFWRYGTQLGGVMMAGVALLLLAQPVPGRLRPWVARRWALPAAGAVLLLLPLAGFRLLWPNPREPAPPLRRTLAALRPAVPQGGLVAVVDPAGNGFGAVVTDFALQGRARVVLPARGFGSVVLDEATLRARLAEDQAGQVLLLSADAATQAALGTAPLPAGGWRLLRREGGAWVAQAAGRLGQGPE